MKLKKCLKCATYTMKEFCPKCKTKTKEAGEKYKEKFVKNLGWSQNSVSPTVINDFGIHNFLGGGKGGFPTKEDL